MGDCKRGDVIEYKDGPSERIGVVLEASKSLLVLGPDGSETRIATKAVLATLEEVSVNPDNPATAASRVAHIERDLAALREQANLAEVWELIQMEDDAELNDLDLSEMTEWLFGESGGMEQMAAARLLRDDVIYFKSKRGQYEPRSASQVEQLTIQEQRRLEAERARKHFTDTLQRLFDAGAPGEASRALEAEAEADLEFRHQLELLEQYAITGDEYARRSQADALLDEVIHGVAQTPKGKGSTRAFNLLVGLGRLSPYENLWLKRSRLSLAFPPEIMEAAQARVEQLSWLDAEALDPELAAAHPWRHDLTAVDMVTIDDASTRDIDDALSLHRLMDGTWELGIHIADPAAVVPFGSALEEEARRRGASVYEPTCTLPMFPRALSERAMSLVEGVIRPAISFMATLDEQMEIIDFHVKLSWVKVAARMTYDFADAVMLNEATHPLRHMLDDLRLLSEQLLHRRIDQGAVVLQIPEVKIRVDGPRENGTLMEIDTLEVKPLSSASPSRDLVQEMMVLTGNRAGRWMRDNHLNVLFRGQPVPDDPENEEFMRGTIFPLVESFQARRKMKRSSTSLTPEPHFGLGFDVYVQVTSPIRRYADLLSHYQIHAHLRDDDAAPEAIGVEELRELSAALDGLLSEASSVERESKRFWTLVHLKRHLGETMEGMVVDVIDERRARALVFLTEVALAVPTSLIRNVPVGETIEVRVDNVDPRRDLLVLKMLDPA